MAKGSMRENMPQVTALIDDLRSAFGEEYIDSILRAGMAGKPVFYASENGYRVGTPVAHGVKVVADERGTRCIVVDRDGNRRRYIEEQGRQTKTKGIDEWRQ